jgi:hypothetical protein
MRLPTVDKERAAFATSMRALVLLMGLLAIGDAAATVNAPLTVEPGSAEPREDLFATKPKNAIPNATSNAAPVATPAVAAPPAAPAAPAERGSTGNPLWGIPLSRLTATRERPLFAPTRLPPAVVAVAKPAPAPVAPPKPIEPEKPQLSLLGTIAGREKIGLFIDSASKTVLRLKAGENHKGWTLRDVRPRQVELAKGLDSTVLDLPLPDMKGGAAPPPAMPALAAAPGIPVPSAFPVNAAKATGTPPMPTPAAGATIVVQTPVFKQPPAQANPFQQGRMP